MAVRGADPEPALEVLARLEPIVLPLEAEVYETVKDEALRRIGPRDPDDWPVLACAMMLGCPVWTEDADFFGTGVATLDYRPYHALLDRAARRLTAHARSVITENQAGAWA